MRPLILFVLLYAAAPAIAEAPDSGEPDDKRGFALLESGDPAGAVPLLERGLALREHQYGTHNGHLWSSVINLGNAYRKLGDPRAEALLIRALRLAEAVGDPDFPPVGISANYLGVFYQARYECPRAIPLFEQSLRISEKRYGLKHEEVQTDLHALGVCYREVGDSRAEATLSRALTLAVELWGETNVETGKAADSLARVYINQSEWSRAEPLLLRAHTILIATLGEASPSALFVADLLARAAFEKHDLDGASRILARAQTQLGDSQELPLLPARVALLSTGAAVLTAARRHGDAIGVLRSAVSIQERIGGADPVMLVLLNNLGAALAEAGELDPARTVMEDVVSRERKLHGAGSPRVLLAMSNLTVIMMKQGDLAGAEQRYRELTPQFELAFGKNHPQVAGLLGEHGAVLAALGRVNEAWPLLRIAASSLERATAAALQTGTEAERLRYVMKLDPAVSVLTALALDPKAPSSAVTDALELTLGFKGRALEATAATAIAARRRAGPTERRLLLELGAARRELGADLYQGSVKTATLVSRVEDIERQLANSNARVIEPVVNVAAVRGALPGGAALVEIVMYRPVDRRSGTTKWGAYRYVAYVLEPTGEPRQVDLGEAAVIDHAVTTLVETLSDPGRDHRAAAREVDRLVMAKIRPLLHTRWLYISPDGALSAVPFNALIDAQGHYAIEDHAITVLTSGRDLLHRPRTQRPSMPVIFGDPDFGDSAAAPKTNSRSSDLGTVRFQSLTGTAVEARALGQLLPGARVLTRGAASEAALKKIAGPPIVHLATHGFFLSDLDAGDASGSRGLQRTKSFGGPESPLLRAGLAFAGANPRTDGEGEDGILTALEASGLDLDGTRLVVLSACETGLGAITAGEGVRGLGRAFVVAGAETLVTSLWKVSDDATRDLMIDYYRRLVAGGGRGEAMRQAQLAMLRAPATRHPYYWASFVVSGDVSALDGKPILPSVTRGPRGCSCSGSTGGPAGLVMPLFVIFLLRRSSKRRVRRA